VKGLQGALAAVARAGKRRTLSADCVGALRAELADVRARAERFLATLASH
jgi:hypothetical protein